MSILQSTALSQSTVKVRWQEPYISAGLNQQALASHPKGVVAGFSVAPNGGLTVAVQVDSTLGVGLANVWDTTAGTYAITVVQPTSVIIDLTPQANLTVFIVLDAQYSVGSTTSAQILVVDDPTTDADWIVLAKVSVPGSGSILTSHINTGYRQDSGIRIPDRAARLTNLVRNPGFENGTTAGWYSDGTFTTFAATSSVSYSGSWCLQLSRTAAGTSAVTSAPMPVSSGLKYRVSGRFRTVAGLTGGNGAKFQVGWFDVADTQIGGWEDIETAITSPTVSPPFAERLAEVTAPASAARARLRLLFDGCSGTLFVDDVEFSTSVPLLQQTEVFGGAQSVADAYHMHTAAGQAYAGNTGPAPANWVLAAGNIEGVLDQIGNDLSGSAGATKIGFVATTPVDLPAGAVTVKSALDTLDDTKAGLSQANTFLAANSFANSLTANQAAVTALGNGTGAGLAATGGGTGPSSFATRSQGAGVVATGGAGNAHGVVGQGGSGAVGTRPEALANSGVLGVGAGSGAGVVGVSAPSNGAYGVIGYGSTGANTTGVYGEAGGNGIGVAGYSTGSGAAISGSASGSGHGVYGTSTGGVGHGVVGAVGAASSFGVLAQNTALNGTGLRVEALTGLGAYVAAVSGIDVVADTGFAARLYNEGAAPALDVQNGDGGPAAVIQGSNGYNSSVVAITNVGSPNAAYSTLEVVGSTAKGISVSTTGTGAALTLNQSGSGQALVIQGNSASIVYNPTRPMTASILGGAWNLYSWADQGGPVTSGWVAFSSANGPSFVANAAGVVFLATAQVRLPLNAVVTQVQVCVSHSGSVNFSGAVTMAVSKQFPNGASIGGTTYGVANGMTPAMSAGASTQVFTVTLGSLSERTISAVDQVLTVEFQATSLNASASATIRWAKIDYDMADWLYLP